MFCSPSFMSQREPRGFLINRSTSAPHFDGISKQNCQRNRVSDSKATKISLRKSYNSCSKIPLNKSLKRFDERVVCSVNKGINIQQYDKYNCNPQKRTYFGFTSMRSLPQIKNSNISTSKNEIQDQRLQTVGLQLNRMVENPLQTLRIQKNNSKQISNLKKTRKSIQFSKQFAFKPLKQSLISIQSKNHYKQKVQQSLIMVDFFHPSQRKLQQLSPFIQSEISQTPSITSFI